MRRFRDIPISAKLTILMAGMALASLLVGFAAMTALDARSLRRELVNNATLMARMYSEHCVADLAFGYRDDARQILEKLSLAKEINHAAIYDQYGKLFAHYSRAGADSHGTPPDTLAARASAAHLSGGVLEIIEPMSYKGVTYGTLCINASTSELSRRIFTKIKVLGVLAVCITFLSLLISTQAQRLVSIPILKLAGMARRVAEAKDYSMRAGMDRGDEIGALADGFDAMLSSLETRIRERDTAEEALRQAHSMLEEKVAARTADLKLANEELEAFTYSASHDLRAPLRRIDGFSSLLEQECAGMTGAGARDYLARIRKGCRQMAEVVDDLLKLSRIMRQGIQFEKVDLSALAREAAGRLLEAEPGRAVKFKAAENLYVTGDAGLLGEVIGNLLENAWKFTRKTENAAVKFGAAEQGGEMVYFVKDNGKGFDMKFYKKLFHPFQRLHSPDEFPGTGVGLSTVRRIVERHGGRIWAEAAEDKGAAFYFTISAPKNNGPVLPALPS